jgi:transformation/transcription domain-associated protein
MSQFQKLNEHSGKNLMQMIEAIVQEDKEFEKIDLSSLRSLFLYEDTRDQAEAAMVMLRSSVELMLDIPNGPSFQFNVLLEQKNSKREDTGDSNVSFSDSKIAQNATIKCVMEGLMHAMCISFLQDEAKLLLQALLKQFVYSVSSNCEDVRHVDMISIDSDVSNERRRREPSIQNGKLNSLGTFGRFVFSGKLKSGINFFLPTEIIAQALCSRKRHTVQVSMDLIADLFNIFKSIDEKTSKTNSSQKTLWMESLLFSLFQACFSCSWEQRSGLYSGLSYLLTVSDQNWCKLFELELFHLAFYCLKDVPLEATLGQKDALVFFRQLLYLLYQNREERNKCDKFTHEPVFDGDEKDIKQCCADTLPLSDDICDFLFSELSNSRSIVRTAARLGIDFLFGGESNGSSDGLNEIFKKQSSVIRRLLFNRSLRHLQLQDQIATIEAFNFTIMHAPDVLSLSDNHTIIFLSELLKIMSVGDGEMTSESIPSSCIVDKDGLHPKVSMNGCMIDKMSPLTHSTSIFLRGAFTIVQGEGIYRAKIDGDLPVGVRYRVATLQLFGKILKENTNHFLEAEPTSSLGNILPHIVSLLFRSLASRPEEAVEIAHEALRGILTRDSEVKDGEHHKHGLPRHLLQLCIRPVLLNLRDYTKLTIPLLRGLSRLMALLSSWFSKTLGEKLLELLQRWYEPEKIKGLRQWKQGEEPLVAAELISMFQMLPDESSNFVEPLIKTTLKLEAVLHNYMGFFTESPFRRPLCQYLNKHGPAVVLFFINDRRLKNPIYSELLQDIARRKESSELRKHLSSTECSTILLNVCFERPLAIIRSEKGQSGSSRTSAPLRGNNFDALTMHGIVMDAPSKKTALEHQIKLKEEKLKVVKKEECKAKDMVEKEIKKASSVTLTPEQQRAVDALKQKHARTLVLMDSAEKELALAKEDYANELATLNTQSQADNFNDDKNSPPKPMTFDSLELQHQGFVLAEALMSNDDNYTSGHHNLFRTFRWLWRSKGRHFRLLHEDVMPSRFISESRHLATFTVAYSKTAPPDIVIVFDLVRTFLQPTSADFTFVRDHLHDTVCNRLPIEQKKKVLMRFLPVIVSEGLEELKVVTCQNIMIPMLKHCLKTSSVNKDSTVTSKRVVNDIDMNPLNNSEHGESSPNNDAERSLIDSEFLQKMADDILAKDTIKEFGARVTVELLKLCCLLLDYARDQLGDKQQDFVKFAWKVLKCDDPKAKHWAYIAICKIIAYFDAPEKTTLQVYVALLRAHSQDTKDLVRTALDVLLPVIPRKLTRDNQKQAVRSTIKILHEEANSAPHLNHIWYTVVRHDYIFYESRRKLVPHLVSSLTRFGLPSNVSTESKALAIALVQLLLQWSKMQDKGVVEEASSHDESHDFDLNQNEVNTIVNFLVRLVLLIAVADKTEQKMESKISSLFQEVIIRWSDFRLRIEYFEKVLSMCENELKRDDEILMEKRLKKGDKAIINNQNASKRGKKNGDTIRIPTLLLSSCLNIFTHIVRYAPSNRFLNGNTSKLSYIIRLCFKHVNEAGSSELWKALIEFIKILYSTEGFDNMKQMMRYILEEFLIAGVDIDNVLAGVPSKSKKEKIRFDVIEKALYLIEVASKSNRHVLDSFSSVIITVTETLIKHNLENAAKDRKAAKSSYTVALVNEAVFESSRASCEKYFSSRLSETFADSDSDISEKKEKKTETDCLFQCICLLRFDSVVFHLTSDRKRYLAIMHNILENISDVKILLAMIRQISRWILAEDHETPLTRNEVKSLMTSLMQLDSQCLPVIDGELLMCALAFITYQICALHFHRGPQRNAVRNGDEFLPFINRCSVKFLMSSKPQIRSLFCKMLSDKNASFSELKHCVNAPRFQYIQNGISGRKPLDLLKLLLASDLQGLAFSLWTFTFNDVLLARTYSDGANIGSVRGPLNMNIVPSSSEFSESSYFLQNEHALDLTNYPTSRAKFISALRILASSDSELNQELLEKLINAAWCSSTDEGHQLSTVPFIEQTLLRPYHVQFLKSSISDNGVILHSTINAVKSFLRAINLLDPLPNIDVDILISSAVNYSCWHEVRSILEKQHGALTNVSNKDLKRYEDALSSSIRRCYLEIGEKDTWLSLRAEVCKLPGIQKAARHDMYSNITDALESYVHLMDIAENEMNSDSNDGFDIEQSVAFLEERWVALQRESCAWNVLEEFLGEDGPFKLMIECAWKTKNWEKLRGLCSSPSAVSALELGDMDVKMSEILLAISDGKLNEVENLHAQTAQLCLYNWQLLPPLYSGCDTHCQILHMFNRLVDIRESGQIMVEASHHTNNKSYPDFKSILNSWRNRLPGSHEPISYWDNIFLWRSHMFSAVETKFQWVEQNMLATLHDRPWSAIRFAQTAREQGVDEISLMSIGQLSDCAMAVGDAFSKLKEQILLYKNGGENERKAGLNLISTTNLSFFDPSQKSELFRLKGDFLDLIANSYNGKTKASQAYCHAVQLCPTYSRSWVSWGGLCWSLGEILERQHRSLSSETEEEKEKKESMAKKFIQYYAQAMGCYLEAVKCDSSEDSRIFIPRVLLCLSKDGTNPDLLCQTFDKYALALPAWVWLPWIPQLLSSLCRAEAKTVKSILTSILSAYPQSLYFSLRSFYLERRDIERSRINKDSIAQSGNNSVSFAEDLMSFLRKNQPILWMSLETIIEELIIRFRPSYEEELLATITALVTRVDAQLENQHSSNDDDDTENETISASFRRTLTRISTKFFSTPSDSSSEQDTRSKRTAEFTVRYKDVFIEDFGLATVSDNDKQELKLPLDQIIIKLKKWKRILEAKISSTPPMLPLMQASPTLSSFTNIIPDLWPGACGPEDDKRERSDKDLESSQNSRSSYTASVELAEKAAIAVRAANAYENYGDGRGGGWIAVEIPGQYAPNCVSGGKPSPELHAKVVKFESNVEVSRRNQQLVRRIGMLGSDGRIYHFLLQFTIPYWTRADERTAQLNQIFDRCIRKEKISARRHLWLRPTAILPVAQRLRMIAEERHHVSLEQIFSEECVRNGFDEQDISDMFIEEVRKYRIEHQSEEATKAARVHALNVLCKEKVSSSILKNYIWNLYGNVEKVYQFNRAFTTQTALNSLLQYAFDINERTPSKFMFNSKNGHVLSLEFRLSYSNQGFIDEKRPVPFRLTRNIESVIGPFLMKGIFTPAMVSGATAICSHEADLEQTLQLLFRDDIVSWYLSKSSGSQRPMHELERQLSDRVRKNIYLVQNRLRECSVIEFKRNETDVPIDDGVRKLISAATSIDNIAQMPSTYAPWL